MIDNAAIAMQQGESIAAERVRSVNDNTLQSHYHPFFEIFYLESGERNVVVGDRVYALKPFDFIIYPPYTMHRSYSEQDVTFSRVVVYFTEDEVPEGLRDGLSGECRPYAMRDREAARALGNLIDEMTGEERIRDGFREMMLSSGLGRFLVTAHRLERSDIRPLKEPKIAKIISYVHDNYFDSELSLGRLQDRFYISSGHLCREFKRFTQCSFVEYLSKIRVLHAQRLFVESDDNLTRIALETGFGSLTSFERAFMRHTGEQPGRVCRRMRRNRARKGEKPRLRI